MPKRISHRTRATIQELSRRGWSVGRIKRELNVCRNTVKRWRNRNTVQDLSRRPSLVTRYRRRMIALVRDERMSVWQVAQHFEVSRSTVRRAIRRSVLNPLGLFPYRGRSVVSLTPRQTEQRRSFCAGWPRSMAGMTSTMTRRVYADEKPFKLSALGNVQNQRFWANRLDDVADDRERTAEAHPTVIHVFASISWHHKSLLHWFVDEGQFVRGPRAGMNVFLFY